MSVILRPNGDKIAKIYGVYYTESEVENISISDRVDVLCDDGLNYIGVVERYDKLRDIGLIHFLRWSRKFDYTGPFKILYLTFEGNYSKAQGISYNNHYPQLLTDSSSTVPKNKKLKQDTPDPGGRMKSQRYSDDFLSKPRMKFHKIKDRLSNSSNESSSESKLVLKHELNHKIDLSNDNMLINETLNSHKSENSINSIDLSNSFVEDEVNLDYRPSSIKSNHTDTFNNVHEKKDDINKDVTIIMTDNENIAHNMTGDKAFLAHIDSLSDKKIVNTSNNQELSTFLKKIREQLLLSSSLSKTESVITLIHKIVDEKILEDKNYDLKLNSLIDLLEVRKTIDKILIDFLK